MLNRILAVEQISDQNRKHLSECHIVVLMRDRQRVGAGRSGSALLLHV